MVKGEKKGGAGHLFVTNIMLLFFPLGGELGSLTSFYESPFILLPKTFLNPHSLDSFSIPKFVGILLICEFQ